MRLGGWKNQPSQTLQIRLRRPLFETLTQMYQATRPVESKISLETFTMMLLETVIADFRASKLPPQRVFNNPHDCKAAYRTNWLGALPPW
jgi:hypothetical protein